MPLTTVQAVFGSPWGIVEHRRGEIEIGHFGAFDRIYGEEVARWFLSIDRVAGLLECHESTARKAMQKHDCRYLAEGNSFLYYLKDVEMVRGVRARRKQEKKSAAA